MSCQSKLNYTNPCPTLQRCCNSRSSPACSVYFPFELFIDILERLPLRSLLRFRCVCKGWYNLITSPKFIYSHLKRSKQSDFNYILIIRTLHSYLCYPDFFVDYANKKELSSLLNTRSYNVSLLPDEFGPPLVEKSSEPGKQLLWRSSEVLGDCDGLLCMFNVLDYNKLALCNPITGDFRILPPSDGKYLHFQRAGVSVGFGFDRSNDDYKVVHVHSPMFDGTSKYENNVEDESEDEQVTYDGDALAEFKIKVYSMRTNVWRTLIVPHDSITYSAFFTNMGVFFNDTLHFPMIIYNEDAPCILTFHLPSERVGSLPMPKSPIIMKTHFRLKTLGGCLCLVTSEEIWIMKKYGEADSWTKLLSTEGDSKSFVSLSQSPQPIAHCSAKRGEDFLILNDFDNDNQLWMYDSNKGSLEQLTIPNMVTKSYPLLFVGSLVRIPDLDLNKQNQEVERLSRKRRRSSRRRRVAQKKRTKIELREI